MKKNANKHNSAQLFNNYLDTLNKANALLADNTNSTPFQYFIDIIGSSSSADRAYIFLNHTGATGEKLMSHIAEWCSDPSKSNIDNPNLQNIRYDKYFPRWYEVLSKGEIITGQIDSFPKDEQTTLQLREVHSISIVPILFGGEFVGFTGFDYFTSTKRQMDTDLSFLQASTYSLAHRIEQDWVLSRLQSENNLFKGVMDALDMTIFAIDSETHEIIYMNKFAIFQFGDCIGRKCWNIFQDKQSKQSPNCNVKTMIDKDGNFKEPYLWEEYFPKIKQWCRVSTQAMKWPDGRIVLFQILTNITQHKVEKDMLQKNIEEKDSLLGEVHHRVKNNLQSLIYLISMQADYVKNKHAEEILNELKERIKAMSLVHSQLYLSKNLSSIHIDKYVTELLTTLLRALSYEQIQTHFDLPDITLDIKTAIPLGLIINELVTNIIKHAFKHQDNLKISPEIKISFKEKDDNYILIVSDNGAGFTMHPEYLKHTSMGLKLVTIWSTHQLSGTLNINEDEGVKFIITFPKKR